MKITSLLLLLSLFSGLIHAQNNDDELGYCKAIIKKNEMQQSNSSEMQFCFKNIFDELSQAEIAVISDTGIILYVGRADKNYSKNSKNKYLRPFYLINLSKDIISVQLSDNLIPMIQEAKDENGNWKPVEYWLHSTCGYSYDKIEISPNGQMCFPIRNYKRGSFSTLLRVKVRIDGRVYYSNIYQGKINKSKFNRWRKLAKRDIEALKKAGETNLKKIKTTFVGDGFLEN